MSLVAVSGTLPPAQILCDVLHSHHPLLPAVQVRIDVYCVRLNHFKAYGEEMIKRLREALAGSLRKRVS